MIGKTVSHYQILEKLGAGGMGIVYKAQDLKLDRYVALKFLPRAMTHTDEAKRRFIHEAKAASAIDHTNICTVYEIDETSDGQMFIAMAYCEGESLHDRVARGPLDVPEALEIAKQAATALDKAHEKEILHRDVKPENILITEDGTVKLVDFGVAKLAGSTKLTQPGAVPGTLVYMSPEQVSGEEVDARSDVFSLGLVLYEMLSGKPPFRAEQPAAIIYQMMHTDPAPLSTHREDVPPRLQLVVDKALEKEKGARYQSAGDMLVDLGEVFGTGEKTTAKYTVPDRAQANPELHDIRSSLLKAKDLLDLKRSQYTIENYLSRKPHDAEGLVLRDQIESAVCRHQPVRGGMFAPQNLRRSFVRSAPAWAVALVVVVSASAVLVRQNWLDPRHQSSNGITLSDFSADASQLHSFIALKDRDVTSSSARVRSGDRTQEIQALSPSRTRILTTNPMFRWRSPESRSELRVTVYNEEGVHWQGELSGVREFMYPPEAPPLQPGASYSWGIETASGIPSLRSAAAFFEVLAAEEADSLEASLRPIARYEDRDGGFYHLLRAGLYHRHGLLGEAIDETREALRVEPDHAQAKVILVSLLVETGQTDEALAAQYDQSTE